MNSTPLGILVRQLIRRPLRWLVPSVAGAVLALGYAALKKSEYEASQGIIVRDESGGSMHRPGPGRFADADSLKRAHELAVQIVRSPGAVRAALERIKPGTTIDDEKVEATISQIKVAAPGGAEFGKTDSFVLRVKQPSKSQAIALATALADELEVRLNDLRNRRAESLIAEFENVGRIAREELNSATQELAKIEGSMGSDLSELRILSEPGAGDSNLRMSLLQIRQELRETELAKAAGGDLQTFLAKASQDPRALLAAPNRLLDSQPALKRMKEALTESQIRTAQLLGEMSAVHPKVLASVAAQEELAAGLRGELAAAAQANAADLQLLAGRAALLQSQEKSLAERLSRIGAMRASYQNVVVMVRQYGEQFRLAQQQLAEARASQAGASSASLITRIDEPTCGSSPVGLTRSMVLLGGIVGGLACGAGCFFLTVPLDSFSAAAQTASVPASDAASQGEAVSQSADKSPAAESSVDKSSADSRPAPVPAAERTERPSSFPEHLPIALRTIWERLHSIG